jgi:hypothetical protein
MANTPKPVRKKVKAQATAKKTILKFSDGVQNLIKPKTLASPKNRTKAKETLSTLSKKDDKAYLRLQKARAGEAKAYNRKENKLDKTTKVARRARVMGK